MKRKNSEGFAGKELIGIAKHFTREAGMLLYPPACAVCDTILKDRHALVCDECRQKLPWVKEPKCMVCGRPLSEPQKTGTGIEESIYSQEKCSFCSRRFSWFDKGECTFYYTGDIRRSVLRMKFHNRRDQLDFYVSAMEHAHKRFLETVSPEAVVPVPMHKKKRRERGFDQCALLAGKLSEKTGIPVLKNALVRTRYTKPQKGLDAGQRLANIQGAFAAGPALYSSGNTKAADDMPLCIHSVLLIDDIFTTGTTLNEAAKALRLAGVEKIYFLALCAVPDIYRRSF